MALTKEKELLELRVELDGQVIVFERDIVKDGDDTVMEGPRTGRRVDVGDDVAAEDVLVKHVVDGQLHNAERKALRDAEKAKGDE